MTLDIALGDRGEVSGLLEFPLDGIGVLYDRTGRLGLLGPGSEMRSLGRFLEKFGTANCDQIARTGVSEYPSGLESELETLRGVPETWPVLLRPHLGRLLRAAGSARGALEVHDE